MQRNVFELKQHHSLTMFVHIQCITLIFCDRVTPHIFQQFDLNTKPFNLHGIYWNHVMSQMPV